MNAAPLLISAATRGRLELTASGAWTAPYANELERLIDGIAGMRGAGSIDLHKVEALDTFGAWLLERLIRERRAHGDNIQVIGLPERYSGLIGEVHHANLESPQAPAAVNPVLRLVNGLGRSVIETGQTSSPFCTCSARCR